MSEFATPNFNRQKPHYTLKSVLDLFGRTLMIDFNCHAVATVKKFYPSNQTIDASINYTKTFLVPNPKASPTSPEPNYIQQIINYPPLAGIPIIVMGGGGSHLTFPISPGDECLVLFNDRDISNWLATGQTVQPASTSLHSFSDGIALIGLNSFVNSIENYDSDRALITNGNARVGINTVTNKCSIINDTSTLNNALQTLINGILALTAGGNPVVDVSGDIGSAAIQLGDLLE
jgi:hypothetical protein